MSTTIYGKPTFTGLYTRWDSYCSTDQKLSLIRSFTNRAMKTYSPKNPGDEISKIRSIFERNGYPQPIVDRIIYQTLHLKAPCGRSYVGRTPQELGERIKQHVPDDEPQLAINPGVAPVKRKPGRPKKSVGVTSNAVPSLRGL